MPLELTDHTFDDTITTNRTVVVDLWAPWCGPCLAFAPVFAAAADAHPDIVFAKVDVDTNPQTAARHHIQSIPTLVVYRDQTVVFTRTGAVGRADLDAIVDAVRDLPAEPAGSRR